LAYFAQNNGLYFYLFSCKSYNFIHLYVYSSIVFVKHVFFIHSSVGGHLHWFLSLICI
jgi:hypothetical protein